MGALPSPDHTRFSRETPNETYCDTAGCHVVCCDKDTCEDVPLLPQCQYGDGYSTPLDYSALYLTAGVAGFCFLEEHVQEAWNCSNEHHDGFPSAPPVSNQNQTNPYGSSSPTPYTPNQNAWNPWGVGAQESHQTFPDQLITAAHFVDQNRLPSRTPQLEQSSYFSNVGHDFQSIKSAHGSPATSSTAPTVPTPNDISATPTFQDPLNPVHCKWLLENPVAGNLYLCNFFARNAEALQKHIENEHIGSRKNQYYCHWQGCSRNPKLAFTQKQKVVRHVQTHTNSKPYQCPHCGKRCAEKATLDQHLHTHTGEKPFQCSKCSKSFAARTTLSVHERTHSGEKPLQCSHCSRTFSESSNLSKHMRIHEREKAFKCDFCESTFTRSDQRKRHIRTRHPSFFESWYGAHKA